MRRRRTDSSRTKRARNPAPNRALRARRSFILAKSSSPRARKSQGRGATAAFLFALQIADELPAVFVGILGERGHVTASLLEHPVKSAGDGVLDFISL